MSLDSVLRALRGVQAVLSSVHLTHIYLHTCSQGNYRSRIDIEYFVFVKMIFVSSLIRGTVINGYEKENK